MLDVQRQSRRIYGYRNPTRLYPSALAALVRDGEQYTWIYPDGTQEPVEIDIPLPLWAAQVGCQLLESPVPVYLGEDEYLYGITSDELIVGTHEQISRNLSLRIAHWKGDPQVEAHLAFFVQHGLTQPPSTGVGVVRSAELTAPQEEVDEVERFFQQVLSEGPQTTPSQSQSPDEILTPCHISVPSWEDQFGESGASREWISERFTLYAGVLRAALQPDADSPLADVPRESGLVQRWLLGPDPHRVLPQGAVRRSERDELLKCTVVGRYLVNAMREVAVAFHSLEASGARLDRLVPFLYWRLPRTGERSRATVLRTILQLAYGEGRITTPRTSDAIIVAGARDGGIPV